MEPKNQPPAETLETNPSHGGPPPQPTSSKSSEPQVEVAGDDKVGEKPPESPTSEIQKKQRRAERFGVPVKLSEKEKRNSRAERFGTGPSLQTSSEEQKRKARAERFGSAGDSKANEEAKKKARVERFAQKTEISSLEEEKRKARAIRFSQPAGNPASDTKETKLSTEGTLSADKAIGGT